MNHKGLILLEAASWQLNQSLKTGRVEPEDVKRIRGEICDYVDAQMAKPEPPPTTEYVPTRSSRPWRVKKRTLRRLAWLLVLPPLAYLCGALLAQGFIDTLQAI